jgi:uncharacterized RDD family membrane protein YckC
LLLGLLLFSATLGIGYIAWSLFTWGQGRDEMAVRQVLGFFLCAGLLWGFFVWLVSSKQRSAGDLLAGTVVLHDPDRVLALSR